ncbi:hypothetical protein VKT23_014674 [Stygiomarasmius scandens]|uniref:Uncharacterized protein n=1 Tax=Marasmiellus scandens TaxID=2682957 RepID=A0ABR1J2Q6_9AGAR
MPDWLAVKLDFKSVLGQTNDVTAAATVDETLSTTDKMVSEHPTIFHSILEGVQSGEYAARRESQLITGSWQMKGSFSGLLGATLQITHVLLGPGVYWLILGYSTAIIKESLRLSRGVTTPMKQVVNAGGATIASYYVPEGTSVAIGNTFVHLNPYIFPDPTRFYPERWLEADSGLLEKYLVAFGKGPTVSS